MRLTAATLACLLVATPAIARAPGWFPRKLGECGWVHGRFSIANGSGVRRLWVIGSTHVLNLHDTDEDVPPKLDPANGDWQPFGDDLLGDFLVCAAAGYKPGHMQAMHIRRVRNLIIR